MQIRQLGIKLTGNMRFVRSSISAVSLNSEASSQTAQLQDWDSNTLFGALLSIKEKERDQLQIEDWKYKGGVEFSSEKESKRVYLS